MQEEESLNMSSYKTKQKKTQKKNTSIKEISNYEYFVMPE